MLRLLKNQNPFSVIILFIFTLVIKLKVLLHPIGPVLIKRHFLYNYITRSFYYLFIRSPFAYTLLSVLVLFIQALYINNISVRHKLFPRATYIPAFVYIVLTSIYREFSSFNETLLLNWFLLGAIDIMFGLSQTSVPRKMIYNAAFLLSLTCLFQISFVLFFFLLVIGMVMFRTFNTGEWAVALMGYLTPIYFCVALLYITGKMYLFKLWPHFGFSIIPIRSSTLYFSITMGGLVVMFMAGVFAMLRNVTMSNIYVRRNWVSISFYFIISIFVAFVTDRSVGSAWLVAMPPLSIVSAHALSFEKNKRFSNFMFYFSLLFMVFCLWANK